MPRDICKPFGLRIRELRGRQRWSQEELAFRAGMAASYLSDVENGKKELCLRKMNKLAKALDVSLAYLMRGL